ncbi:hypothetical protein [Virgibacillus ainsalahensis]
MGRVIAAPDLLMGRVTAVPRILENSLLVKLAVFIKDGGGMILAAMLVS